MLGKQAALTLDSEDLTTALAETADMVGNERSFHRFLELVKTLYVLHQVGSPAQKRRITEIAFSNRTLTGKTLYLEPEKWLQEIDIPLSVLCGAPGRDRTRTKEHIKSIIEELNYQTASVS